MIHYLSTDKSTHWSPHGYGLSHHLHTIVKRLIQQENKEI